MSSEECIYPVVNRARTTMVENKPKNISILSGGRSTYSDITSGQPKQGRGSGNRGRGGNNNRRPKNRGGRGGNHNPNKAKKSSFKGACVELKGAIFDIGSGQTLLYNNTLDKILTYGQELYSVYAKVNRSNEGYVLPLHRGANTSNAIIWISYHKRATNYL